MPCQNENTAWDAFESLLTATGQSISALASQLDHEQSAEQILPLLEQQRRQVENLLERIRRLPPPEDRQRPTTASRRLHQVVQAVERNHLLLSRRGVRLGPASR